MALVNEWHLYACPMFEQQLRALKDKAKAQSRAYRESLMVGSTTKLLRTVETYIQVSIPTDPSASQFRQGNTLGKENRQWFRAKFHLRYRLFFRFSTVNKAIVYAWMNDEATLRKSGSKTDPYTIFESMLEAGDPPKSFEELLARSREF